MALQPYRFASPSALSEFKKYLAGLPADDQKRALRLSDHGYDIESIKSFVSSGEFAPEEMRARAAAKQAADARTTIPNSFEADATALSRKLELFEAEIQSRALLVPVGVEAQTSDGSSFRLVLAESAKGWSFYVIEGSSNKPLLRAPLTQKTAAVLAMPALLDELDRVQRSRHIEIREANEVLDRLLKKGGA